MNGAPPPTERPPDGWGLGAPDETEASGAPTPSSQTEADADAPLGRNLDGSAKTSRRGRPRKAPGPTTSGAGPGTGRTKPRKAAAPPRSSSRSGPRAKPRIDYKSSLDGLCQLVGVPLFFVSPLDAAALIVHQDELTTGLDQLANSDPRVAAILDRLLVAGPYGIVLAPVLKIGAQIAVNHNALPAEVGKFLGAVPPEILLQMVRFAPPDAAGAPSPGAAA